MTDNPHVGVVVDLVDPYMTFEAKTGGGGKRAQGGDYAAWWLRRHPGRWALVGEGGLGLSRDLVNHFGLNSANRTSKVDGIPRVYAQCYHPLGETLKEALERRPSVGLYLPEVTRDPFNWTRDELADAAQVARANLFPTGAR